MPKDKGYQAFFVLLAVLKCPCCHPATDQHPPGLAQPARLHLPICAHQMSVPDGPLVSTCSTAQLCTLSY